MRWPSPRASVGRACRQRAAEQSARFEGAPRALSTGDVGEPPFGDVSPAATSIAGSNVPVSTLPGGLALAPAPAAVGDVVVGNLCRRLSVVCSRFGAV